MDVAVPRSAGALVRLVRRLLAEVTRPAGDGVVALREDGRWVRGFERSPLPYTSIADKPIVIAEFPHVRAWHDRMAARPAVQRAMKF